MQGGFPENAESEKAAFRRRPGIPKRAGGTIDVVVQAIVRKPEQRFPDFRRRSQQVSGGFAGSAAQGHGGPEGGVGRERDGLGALTADLQLHGGGSPFRIPGIRFEMQDHGIRSGVGDGQPHFPILANGDFAQGNGCGPEFIDQDGVGQQIGSVFQANRVQIPH